MKHKYTNDLIHATSPYLLQHAHNPVNWRPWDNKVVEDAKKENKLILLSIGYAACHWCHVMEHESFEDEQVAAIMNENYICVKIDREERPEVDHYYMTSVQLMQGNGGWPLNVVALPDGRPIWGGTYFPKESWKDILIQVAEYYKSNRAKAEQYASQLQEGIEQVSLAAEIENVVPASANLIKNGVEEWKSGWDMELGGRVGAPKFPMPVTLDFLLYYGYIKKDGKALEYVNTTLEKMARGGIYDQIGGGFARYSVDKKWKVPHFEKMLYDNGQLLSIYSKAFQQFKNEEFKSVVYETIDFLKRELMDESGAFYSSLDADSEGVEGKFYVWNKAELQGILGDDFNLFAAYYNINAKGFWEHNNYILLRDMSNEAFCEKHEISIPELQKKVSAWKKKLLAKRSERIRPGLDDKTLCSWNALVIQGLVDAYVAFKDEQLLELAIQNASFLQKNVMDSNGRLFHSWKNGKATIDGFMEDYALLIQSYIWLFESTGEEKWLTLAEQLTNYSFQHFFNKKSGLFYFSNSNVETVVTNHFQKEDNVLPAANSVMANNLHRLYLILGNPDYLNLSNKMLQHVNAQFANYPMAYANWGNLMLKTTEPYFEVAVCGAESGKIVREMQQTYQPNILWAHGTKPSAVPLLQARFVKGKNLIYVCRQGVCQLPVESIKEALNLTNTAE